MSSGQLPGVHSEPYLPLRSVLWWAGALIGGFAAVEAYAGEASILLAAFVFGLTTHLVGQVLGDALLGPERLERALASLLLPVTFVAIALGAWAWWGSVGWAVVAGTMVGTPVHAILLGALFPRIAAGRPPDAR